jgi:hypothetical protein
MVKLIHFEKIFVIANERMIDRLVLNLKWELFQDAYKQ